MDEENIYEILNSYKEAIDVLLGRCDELVNQNKALEERQNKIESILFDEILEPARLALEADDKERRFGEFNEKFGEKLGAYDKVLGAAEGNPDFSMARSAFDEYEKIPEPRPEEDVFVDGLVEEVEKQIEGIKESLGLPADSETVIKQDEDGNTTIESDGEVVAEETSKTSDEGEEKKEEETSKTSDEGEEKKEEETSKTSDEGEEKKEEETVEASGDEGQGEFDFDEEVEDDPEEVKKFEEELEKLNS